MYLQAKCRKMYTRAEAQSRGGILCQRRRCRKDGASHSNLYFWKEKLFAGECTDEMKKPEEPLSEAALEALRAENAALVEAVESLRRENMELEKTRHRLQLEVDVLKKADEILKKEEGVNPNNLSNQEKAAVIDALRNAYRLKELLDCLHLSKSSYFYQERVLNRPDKYQNLRQEIREAFAAVNGCYGYRRLHAVLKGLGRSVSEKVIRRVMKEERLVVRNIRHRHYNSYLGEISPAAPNLINRNFHAEKPNEKWLTDITEFRLPAGKVYLSPIIDCFDGMAVTWTIGHLPTPGWSILCWMRLFPGCGKENGPSSIRTGAGITAGRAGSSV